ncbi:MAG: SDR family oxidoreductase [Propionibacteriaceae bacterium]|nr:SDR family oxidoreductase [Propionibacteriaceae bacterium]
MVENTSDLAGRLALVTGSARGLGNTYARGLAAAGCRVVLHGRSAELLAAEQASIGKQFGVDVFTARFDVSKSDEVFPAIEALLSDHGVPDILVNNAGVQRRAPFHEFPVSDWDEVVATNLNGTFYVSRAVAPGMVERGSGKIVNIGSVTSLLARQTVSPYTATKGAVAMLSKAMAADLTRYNIQVNTISPGYFRTDMNEALMANVEFDSWVRGRTPAGRWGEPSELLGALLFLSSSASDFVSGQNIFVDGGMTSVI